MRITPLDVRKQEFKRGMRGYDNDEVRAFLVNLADEYEAVLVDNKQLRERLVEQDEKLTEYRNLEQTLRDTLMTAEKLAQQARETARREGEVLLAEARQRVERVLGEGRERLNELRREALAVHREKEAYLGRFRSFAEAQILFVEQHRGDFKELDGRLLDQLDLASGAVAQDLPATSAEPAPGDPPATAPPHLVRERDEWREYKVTVEDQPRPNNGLDDAERIAAMVQDAGAEEPPASEASQANEAPAPEEAPHH